MDVITYTNADLLIEDFCTQRKSGYINTSRYCNKDRFAEDSETLWHYHLHYEIGNRQVFYQ
jgi:hypothetical protein